YRAQVIAQNVCYNQPPHLDYNLRQSKKIVRQCLEYDTGVEGLGKYWDCLYTTYPLVIPEGINAWLVTGRKYTNDVDTLLTTKLKAGTVIAANSGILYNSTSAEATFTPSSLTDNQVSSSFVSGSYCDTTLPAQSGTQGYYVFACGDRGPGFYLTSGATVEHGTGYVSLKGTTAAPLAQSYVLGIAENPLADGIDTPLSASDTEQAVYNLQGIRLTKAPEKGIFIQGGKKQAR
ncbi:MAG: hypothetical protein LUC33_06160, partial [Prevotellaceae bacterium]|nr:hypothetical protein [Prevotellaceae bacterium]